MLYCLTYSTLNKVSLSMSKILVLNLDLGLKNTHECKQCTVHKKSMKIAYWFPVLIEEFFKIV